MERSFGSLTLDQFKLALILNKEFTDYQIKSLMKRTILVSEEEVLELCAILSKYRPDLYKEYFNWQAEKADIFEMSEEEKWEQKISFAYGNLKLHDPNNPNITKDLVRKVAEALKNGGL